jgi:hypothetical protein
MPDEQYVCPSYDAEFLSYLTYTNIRDDTNRMDETDKKLNNILIYI